MSAIEYHEFETAVADFPDASRCPSQRWSLHVERSPVYVHDGETRSRKDAFFLLGGYCPLWCGDYTVDQVDIEIGAIGDDGEEEEFNLKNSMGGEDPVLNNIKEKNGKLPTVLE